MLVSDISKKHRPDSLHTLTKLIRFCARTVQISKTHHSHCQMQRRDRSPSHGSILILRSRPARHRQRASPSHRTASLIRHRVSHCMQPLHWSPLGVKCHGIAIRLHLGSSQRDEISGGGFHMHSMHCDLPQHFPFICFLRTAWCTSPSRPCNIQFTTEAGPAARSFTSLERRRSKDRFTRVSPR